jgi:hypothetical protein
MVASTRIASPDSLTRTASFAVEVIDPVSLGVVSRKLDVDAEGLRGRPIVNYSGRFVWIDQGDRWPTAVVVTPAGLPFSTQVVSPPPRPADPNDIGAEARLLRVVLRPTPAYPFEAGVTSARGRLRLRPGPSAPGLAGVRVQLAWRDEASGRWLPAPPSAPPPSATNAPSPVEQETDEHGDFAAFLRLRPRPSEQPEFSEGVLRARLQFTRLSPNVETRVTPDTFVFLPGVPAGHLPEGQPLPRDLSIVWSRLVAA